MEKNTKIIIGIISFFVILAVAGYMFLSGMFVGREDTVDIETGDGGGIFGLGGGGDTGDGFVGDDISSGVGTTTPQNGKQFIPQLRQVYENPISGFYTEFDDEDETNLIRFVDRSSGHIYETTTDNLDSERISNTTILGVQEAVWLNLDNVILRYFGESGALKSFYASITDEEGGGLEGSFLDDNIKQIVPLTSRIFYTIDAVDGLYGVISQYDGSRDSVVFESRLKDWFVERPTTGYATFTTKASNYSKGYMYLFNFNTYGFSKIIDETRSLTTLTDGEVEKVLVSKGLDLSIYDLSGELDLDINARTLSEKCVWSLDSNFVYCGIPKNISSGDYPDDWYKGKVSFDDNIYRIDVETGDMDLLVSPEDFVGENIDLINPQLTSNGEYLIFINKKDLSLWSLELVNN